MRLLYSLFVTRYTTSRMVVRVVWLFVARWVRRAWWPGGHLSARRAVFPRLKAWVYGCVNGFAAVNAARIYCFYDGYWWFFGERWVRRAWRRGGVAARRAVGASRMAAGVVWLLVARKVRRAWRRGGYLSARRAVSHA